MKYRMKLFVAMMITAIVLSMVPASASSEDESYVNDSQDYALLTYDESWEIIEFGGFYWIVLDEQYDRTLVISEKAIFARRFHQAFEAVTWENSEIREHLNGEFLESMSPQDQERIAVTAITNDNNPWFGVYGGNDTSDKVFLLSIEEVVNFFGDRDELAYPLDRSLIFDYRQKRIAITTEGWLANWWLRSPGHIPMSAAFVRNDGVIVVSGVAVDDVFLSLYVRPAMWLYLH